MSSEQAPQESRIIVLGQYAGFVTRLSAWLIDYLIVAAVLAILAWLTDFILDLDVINELLGTNVAARVIVIVIAYIVGISFLLSYFLGFWILAGQTPGKWLMGVRIVRTDGERLHFLAALVRLLGYLLSFILFLGYLWVLVDNKRQAWHDKLAGSLVVYSWPEEGTMTTAVGDKVHGFRARREARKQAEELEGQET